MDDSQLSTYLGQRDTYLQLPLIVLIGLFLFSTSWADSPVLKQCVAASKLFVYGWILSSFKNKNNSITIDGLNVSNWESENVYRDLRKGNVNAINATTATWENYTQTLDNISAWYAKFNTREDISLIRNVDDIFEAADENKIGIILGFLSIIISIILIIHTFYAKFKIIQIIISWYKYSNHKNFSLINKILFKFMKFF